MAHRTQRNILLIRLLAYYNRIRDSQMKEMYTTRYEGSIERLPTLRRYCSSSTSTCSSIQSSQNSVLWGFFMEPSSCSHDWLLIQLPAPFLLLNPGRWSWKFQASNQGLVLPVANPHHEAIQEPTKSRLIRTKDIPITQEIPRDLKALSRTGVRDQILVQKMFHAFIT